jgi:hypothetical protein
MSEANLTHLFIYGTLLEASQHPMGQLLRDNGSFIARGSIAPGSTSSRGG